MIPHCPITVQDIENTDFIWGPDLGCAKGKTARQTSPKMRVENTRMPVSIMQQYNNVTLSVDTMKVTGMAIARHIKFGSAGKLDSMKTGHLPKHFKALSGAYVTRGFKVTIILADN